MALLTNKTLTDLQTLKIKTTAHPKSKKKPFNLNTNTQYNTHYKHKQNQNQKTPQKEKIFKHIELLTTTNPTTHAMK